MLPLPGQPHGWQEEEGSAAWQPTDAPPQQQPLRLSQPWQPHSRQLRLLVLAVTSACAASPLMLLLLLVLVLAPLVLVLAPLVLAPQQLLRAPSQSCCGCA